MLPRVQLPWAATSAACDTPGEPAGVHTKPLRLRLRVYTTWEAAHRNGASAADRRQVRYNAAKAIRAETGRGGGVLRR